MKYDNIAFTRHARERLEKRKISREMVIQTIQNPNNQYIENDGKIKFIRKVSGCKVHAICKPIPEENKWLVVTVWVRGEDDNGNVSAYKRSYGGKFINRLTFGFIIVTGIILYIVWNMMLQ